MALDALPEEYAVVRTCLVCPPDAPCDDRCLDMAVVMGVVIAVVRRACGWC